MALFIMFLAQAATAQPLPSSWGPAEGTAAQADYPQLRIPGQRDCARSDEDEIVVCGSRQKNERYRLPPLPSEYEKGPLKAEAGLGGGVTGNAYLDSEQLANGVISKRVMIGIKTKF
jgi:hypothetical protein